MPSSDQELCLMAYPTDDQMPLLRRLQWELPISLSPFLTYKELSVRKKPNDSSNRELLSTQTAYSSTLNLYL